MLTFFTGEPCRNGHIAPRYASNRRCVECKAANDRRHYERYGDAIKTRVNDWYYANRDKARAVGKAYYERMKDDPAFQAPRQAYNAAHYDRLRAIQRAKNSTPEAKAEKAAKRKEQAHLYRSYENKRRARKLGQTPKWYGELDDLVFKEAAHLCELRERATGYPWEIDHMIPLLATRASGLHCATNAQVIPQVLNRRKNRRTILTEPFEWLYACTQLLGV